MAESITHAAIARPSGRLGPLAVEAPDEDGFTLGLAAAEALPGPEGPGRIHRLDLVGDFPPDSEWALPEALDLGAVTVHRSPGGSTALFEALRARPDAPDGASRLVLAVDRARIGHAPAPSHGALGLAFRLDAGEGLRIVGLSTRIPSPRQRVGDRDAPPGIEPGSPPAALLLLGEEALVAPAARRAGQLGLASLPTPSPFPGLGPAPTTSPGSALRAAFGTKAPSGEVEIRILTSEREVRVRIASLAPIRWSEAPTPTAIPLMAPPVRGDDSAPDARAEGAYVPKARYLENLPSRWRLVAGRCGHCSHLTFPPRGGCGACGRADGIEAVSLARDGWTIEAVTTVHVGAQPTEFDLYAKAVGGYDVVIARSRDGPRGTFQVAGPAGSAHIGDRLHLPLRRLYPMEGEWRYGRKAAPIASHPSGA